MKRNLLFFFLLLSLSAYSQQENRVRIEPVSYHFSLANLTKGDTIAPYKDISAASVMFFDWGPYRTITLSSGPPKVCLYDIMVDGVAMGSIAQFSIDNGSTWVDANIGNNQVLFSLYAAPSTQQFWARDSGNPSNVITINISVCP